MVLPYLQKWLTAVGYRHRSCQQHRQYTMQANQGPSVEWDSIPVLDQVSASYEPLQQVNRATITKVLLLVAMTWYGGDHMLLLHKEGTMTLLKGRCAAFGLGDAGDERECIELHGERVMQAIFSKQKCAYVLTEAGALYSSGARSNGQLGRRITEVPAVRFGRIGIDDPVIAVAAGESHVLAMTKTKVFGFGANGSCEIGSFLTEVVSAPTEIYSGPDAPRHVICGCNHSVILTVGGRVLTCGKGGHTGQGLKVLNTPKLVIVRGLQSHTVQQVICTWKTTYALVQGDVYVWGWNLDHNMAVLDSRPGDYILKPALMDFGGRRISALRCSRSLVLALTDMGEVLFWGVCRDGTCISRPQPVDGGFLPREIFARGEDSGGVVYLVSEPASQHTESIAAEKQRAALNEPQGAIKDEHSTVQKTVVSEPVMQHKKKTGDENLRARGELQAILTSYSSQNAESARGDHPTSATHEPQRHAVGVKIHVAHELAGWKQAVSGMERILWAMEDTINAQKQQIRELQDSNQQYETRIEELQECTNQQKCLINELIDNSDQQKQLVSFLQDTNNVQEQQISELEDVVNCPICQDSRIEVVFQCGHSVCWKCECHLTVCHSCRKEITSRTHIYL